MAKSERRYAVMRCFCKEVRMRISFNILRIYIVTLNFSIIVQS